VPFPILSDAQGKFAKALGLPSFETGGVTYLKRLSIIVCDGKVEIVFYPIRKPEVHARDVLKWFRQETRR
jgi:peroxiredoxin